MYSIKSNCNCRLSFVVLLFILAAAVYADGKDMTTGEWLRFQSDLGQEFQELAFQVRDGEQPPIKCATPLFYDVMTSRPTDILYKPVFVEREDSMSYTYATDYFFLHYTDNGSNTIYQYDTQTITPGVPDYIVNAGRILDSVWEHTVLDLGFPPPISDGYYNGGGNDLLDAYFVNIGAYGVTVIDSVLATTPITATTYMFLENDYEGFPGYESNRLNALRVTAAHEFTHVVQFALDATEIDGPQDDQNPAWLEMSATFMEEEHYPAINDYINYLPYFYRVPSWSVRTGTFRFGSQPDPVTGRIDFWRNLHMYGAAVFPIFLGEQYGPEIIGNVWQACGEVPGSNWLSAMDQELLDLSGNTENLATAFQEFAMWNVFTGYRTRSGYFPDAISYDTVYQTARVFSYPVDITPAPDSAFPDNLGANYLILENVSDYQTGLSVELSTASPDLWGLSIIKFPQNIYDPASIQQVRYDTVSGPVHIPDSYEYERLILVLTVLGGDALMVPYTLSVDFLCGDVDGNPNLNVIDAVFLVNHVYKAGPEPVPACAGDVNRDSVIDIADIVYLINYIFKGGPHPPRDCCR